MKRNTLTTAVVASIAGVAGIASVSNAVFLNPDGVGQVLIYPYYTVNAGNDTLLSVVNTTNQGKAVKVRFLEGRNSREVLDFNLYLSPFDVWTAAITTASTLATDPAVLTTNDNSCTAPNIRFNTGLPAFAGTTNRFVAFRNFQYAGSDAGPDSLDRTREGHFEMIEMGVVNNLGGDGFPTLNTLRNITHVAGTGIPANCGAVNSNWQTQGNATGYTPGGGAFTRIDTTAPTGGLFGGAAIVQVANGTYINYNADALEDFRNDSVHSNPGEVVPSLFFAQNAGSVPVVDSFGTIPALGARSIVFDNGRVVVQNWPLNSLRNARAVDAVSAVLAQDTILNEFVTDTTLGAASEWVITFPTKRFYVDPLFTAAAPVAPFTRIFPLTSTPDGTGTSCIDIALGFFDREEGTAGGGLLDFSPRPPGATGPQLCFEAQVVTFNQTLAGGSSTILGSATARNINTSQSGSFQNPTAFNAGAGWASIRFLQNATQTVTRSTESCNGDAACTVGSLSWRYEGLPVTGFWALTIANNNAAPGVRGNYGGAFRHRGSRNCVGPALNPFCVL